MQNQQESQDVLAKKNIQGNKLRLVRMAGKTDLDHVSPLFEFTIALCCFLQPNSISFNSGLNLSAYIPTGLMRRSSRFEVNP